MSSLPLERWITRKLRLRHLELISEVYDCRSILKASKRLSLTQPAVTKAVKDVETTLNLILFERTSRGINPTLYGEAFARHAKIVLAQLRHAGAELENLREGNLGHVSVGTLLAASASLLPQAITALKRAHPGVAITVHDGTYDLLLPALSVGDLDLVVGRLPEHRNREGLIQEELYAEPTCVVARHGHPLAGKRELHLKDLTDQPWILPLPETTLRRQVEKAFFDAKLSLPRNVVESVSILTNRTLLRDSDHISVMPFQVAKYDVEQGMLTILPINLPTTARPVGVIMRAPGDLPPAAKAFLDCLRAAGATMSSQQAKFFKPAKTKAK